MLKKFNSLTKKNIFVNKTLNIYETKVIKVKIIIMFNFYRQELKK